jgi:hypothetical protein
MAVRQLTERERAIIGEHAARHGVVRGLDQSIADADGNIGAPLVRLGTLARLEARGKISPAMCEAGNCFHALFQLGALDGFKAADMGRVPVSGGQKFDDLTPSHERCRARIAEAVAALGGNGSIAASIIWHVVGLKCSAAMGAGAPSERRHRVRRDRQARRVERLLTNRLRVHR